jgi:type II secretory pathway component PulK
VKADAVCTALCLALLATVSFAAAHEYQAGKIVKVEKQESNASSGGPTLH